MVGRRKSRKKKQRISLLKKEGRQSGVERETLTRTLVGMFLAVSMKLVNSIARKKIREKSIVLLQLTVRMRNCCSRVAKHSD